MMLAISSLLFFLAFPLLCELKNKRKYLIIGFLFCFCGISTLLTVGDFSTNSIITDAIKVIMNDENKTHVAFAYIGLTYLFSGFVMFILFLFRKESSKS